MTVVTWTGPTPPPDAAIDDVWDDGTVVRVLTPAGWIRRPRYEFDPNLRVNLDGTIGPEHRPFTVPT